MLKQWRLGMVVASCVFVLQGTATPAFADDLADDGQVWGNVTATGSLDGLGVGWHGWRYWLEGQGRFGNDMSNLSQGLIRPAVGYTLSDHASVWGGYAYIYTDTPFASRAFDEHRLWQQFLWTQATDFGSFTSRSRFEQRFASTGDDAALRFRQLFKLSWPIPVAKDFSLVTSEEIFVNLSNADWGPHGGLDQNRAFAGIGYTFDKHIKAEVGYMNQFINRPTSPDRMTHILALNLIINYPSN
jgi:hypothetical protein